VVFADDVLAGVGVARDERPLGSVIGASGISVFLGE